MNGVKNLKSLYFTLGFSVFILLFSAPHVNAEDVDEIKEKIETGAEITKEVIKAIGTVFGGKDKKEKSDSDSEEDEEDEEADLESPNDGMNVEPFRMGEEEPKTYPMGQGASTGGGYNYTQSYQPAQPYQPDYGATTGGQYNVPNQPMGADPYQSSGGGYNQVPSYQQGYGGTTGGQYYQPIPPQQQVVPVPNQTYQNNTNLNYTNSGQTSRVLIIPQVNASIKQAEYLRNEGYIHYQNTQYQTAIDVLNRAIQLNPMDSYSYFYRGSSYMKLKAYDLAIGDLLRTTELNPGYSYSHSGLGAVYFELKDLENAIRSYTRAIQLNPNNANDYYNRGVAYMMSKQYQPAFEDFSQALRLNPKHADAKINVEFVQRKLNK